MNYKQKIINKLEQEFTTISSIEIEQIADYVSSSIQQKGVKSSSVQQNDVVFLKASNDGLSASSISVDNLKSISLKPILYFVTSSAFAISSSIDKKWLIPFAIIYIADILVDSISTSLTVGEAIILYAMAKHDVYTPQEKESILNNSTMIADENGDYLPNNRLLDAFNSLIESKLIHDSKDGYLITDKIFLKETKL